MATVRYTDEPTLVGPKDPDAVLDYKFDWSEWLNDDTISSSTWIVPDGITKDSDSNDSKTTTIWLSGGTVKQSYRIVNRITTAAGRSQDRTMILRVKEM